MRAKKEKADENFIYYLSISDDFRNYAIQNMVGTSGRQRVPSDVLGDYDFNFPDLKTQKSISKILGYLDEKIDNNETNSKVLQKISYSLFKSLFIEFDPFKENINKKSFFSEDIKQFYSSNLSDSKLGKIPSNWSINRLGDHVDVIKGKSYKSSELKNSDTALVTLKSFNRGGGYREDGLKDYVGKYKHEQLVEDGDLIVALTDITQEADVIGKPAIVIQNQKYSKLVISLDVASIKIKKDSPLTNSFIYSLMLSNRYSSNSLGYTNGTTVLHLQKEAITDFEFCLPKIELIQRFDKISSLLHKKISNNSTENFILNKTKYFLIPKLFSGEMKISDAEKILQKNL